MGATLSTAWGLGHHGLDRREVDTQLTAIERIVVGPDRLVLRARGMDREVGPGDGVHRECGDFGPHFDAHVGDGEPVVLRHGGEVAVILDGHVIRAVSADVPDDAEDQVFARDSPWEAPGERDLDGLGYAEPRFPREGGAPRPRCGQCPWKGV